MKFCLFLLLQLTAFYLGRAQSNPFKIDANIRSIADSHTLSTSAIAGYLNKSFNEETDKIRAAYTWVVENIAYDTDSMYAINWNMGGNLKVTESFRRRKGVCENFAGIFVDILRKAGLSAITIDGYTKEGSFVNRTGHTWGAVFTNDAWFLFDPTWDKDRRSVYKYYMALPADFANSHMPFDPLWQFTDNPVSHRQFQNRGMGKGEAIPGHADSIKAFMRLGELEKLHAIARRMKNTDAISELIKNRLAYLRMQIETIYEEQDMLLYNGAVADLNKATESYNKYINKLNGQLSAVDLSADAAALLDPAETLIRQAFMKIADIGKFVPNHQYNPSSLTVRLREISDKIKLQKSLVK